MEAELFLFRQHDCLCGASFQHPNPVMQRPVAFLHVRVNNWKLKPKITIVTVPPKMKSSEINIPDYGPRSV